MKKFLLAMAILWTVAILAACWMPSEALVNNDGSANWLFDVPYLDKVIHSGMFFIFAILWSLAMNRPGSTLKIIAASIALAVLTELGQRLPMIGRQADLDDAICDIGGAFLGLLLLFLGCAVIARKGGMPRSFVEPSA